MIKKEMLRLIADEGKILTDGEYQGTVIDVLADKVNEWYEIDMPEQVDEEF